MLREFPWAVFALGLVLYAGTWFTWCLPPAFPTAVFVGAAVGGLLSPASAAPVFLAVWTVGVVALGPPQRLLFESYFNEPNYVGLLEQWSGAGSVDLLLAAAVGAAVAVVAARNVDEARRRKVLAKVLLAAVLFNFVPRILQLSPDLLRTFAVEPADLSYHFDGVQLLKTLHLMQRGEPFMLAYRHAMEQDLRRYQQGFRFQSVRSSVLYDLLARLPDPSWMALVAWAATLVVLWYSHGAACRFGEPLGALAAPVLLASFFLYPEMNFWLPYHDLWAGLVLCAALSADLKGRSDLAAGLGGFAFLVREFAAVYLVSRLLVGAFSGRGRRELLPWAAALLLGVLVYAYTVHQAAEVLGMNPGNTAANRLNGSLAFSLATMRFGSIFLAGRDWMAPLLVLAGALGALRMRSAPAAAAALTIALLAFLFLFFGDPGFAQYYGYNYVPLGYLLCGCASAALLRGGLAQASTGRGSAPDPQAPPGRPGADPVY